MAEFRVMSPNHAKLLRERAGDNPLPVTHLLDNPVLSVAMRCPVYGSVPATV
jgi:hypothetical protein